MNDASKLTEINILGDLFSKTGSESVFSRLVELMSDEIKAYVIYKLNGKYISDVDDICSEIFIKLFTKSGKYFSSDKGSYYCWALGVSKQLLCDFLREKSRSKNVLCYSNLGLTDDDICECCVDYERSETDKSYERFIVDEVMRLIYTLNDDIKNCLVLVFVKGYSINEASRILGIDNEIIRSRLSKGRRIIQKTILKTIPNAERPKLNKVK